MVRLGDVCTINPRGSVFPDSFEISFIPMQSATEEGNVDASLIKKYQEVKKGFTSFRENDVLFAKITPCMENGKGGIACKLKNGIGFGSTEFHVLRPNPDLITSKWLYYLTSWPAFRKECEKNMTGSAGQKRVPKTFLENYMIDLPELSEQRRIAATLDKVTDLISKRRQQLDKLDELVKARFVEMFGDPVVNTLGWEQTCLCNVTSKIGSGATPRGGKESYQSEGVSLIRSMNVYDRRFEYKDLAHITDKQASQLDNVIVEENDVFINITGASVARSCIVPSEVLPARVNQHVAIIRCIPSKVNPIYANCMFVNDRFKKQLLQMGESGGATRQAITKQQLEILMVIVPPLELQNQFASFVVHIEKTKATISRSLEKLETLKNALMQEYFG